MDDPRDATLVENPTIPNVKFTDNDRRVVVVSSEGEWNGECYVQLLDAANGVPSTRRLQHGAFVTAFDVRSDGTLLATASTDSTITIWDTQTSCRVYAIQHYGNVMDVRFDDQGERLLSVGGLDLHGHMQVVGIPNISHSSSDTDQATESDPDLTGQGNDFLVPIGGSDDEVVASTKGRNDVLLSLIKSELPSGEISLRLQENNPQSEEPMSQTTLPMGSLVYATIDSTAEQVVALGHFKNDPWAVIWNLASKQLQELYVSPSVRMLIDADFSHDGAYLAVSSGHYSGAGEVRVYQTNDIAKHASTKCLAYARHVSFADSSHAFGFCCDNRTATLVGDMTFESVFTTEVLDSEIDSVSVSNDASMIATTNAKEIALWSMTTQEKVASIPNTRDFQTARLEGRKQPSLLRLEGNGSAGEIELDRSAAFDPKALSLRSGFSWARDSVIQLMDPKELELSWRRSRSSSSSSSNP